MKRIALVCLFAILTAGVAAASAPTIVQGTILNASTGRPVSGVSVSVVAPTGAASAKTDAHGHYVLWDVPAGLGTLTIARDGFTSEQGTICSYPGSMRIVSARMHDHPSVGYVVLTNLSTKPNLISTTGGTWLGPC